MTNTKQKIILKTIELFNRDGFSNVRLKHISDELQMSLGNFTYHFPKKDNLTLSVYEYLTKELYTITKRIELIPQFEQIDEQIGVYAQIQQKYSFFYTDTIEIFRAFPQIMIAHQEHSTIQIERIQDWIEMNVKTGGLEPSIMQQNISIFSEMVWCNIVLYPSKTLLRGKQFGSLNHTVWLMFYPYFTEETKIAYLTKGYGATQRSTG